MARSLLNLAMLYLCILTVFYSFQSAEARVFASLHASIHLGAGKGQADGARRDVRWSVTKVQRAVCGILSVPRPAVASGYMHWPVWGTLGDQHHQHRRAQQVGQTPISAGFSFLFLVLPVELIGIRSRHKFKYDNKPNATSLCCTELGGKKALYADLAYRSCGIGAWD